MTAEREKDAMNAMTIFRAAVKEAELHGGGTVYVTKDRYTFIPPDATQDELDAMQRQGLIPPQFAVFVMDQVDGGMTMLYAGTHTDCERRMRALGTVHAGDGMEAVELGVYARDPDNDRWVQMP